MIKKLNRYMFLHLKTEYGQITNNSASQYYIKIRVILLKGVLEIDSILIN